MTGGSIQTDRQTANGRIRRHKHTHKHTDAHTHASTVKMQNLFQPFSNHIVKVTKNNKKRHWF